jgi:hypothetical protein
MADVKIKILSYGRIPGYPVNGPILNPIVVDEKVAMKYINAGLDVHIWNDQANDYVCYSSLDMVDTFHDKNRIENASDIGHKCPVCGNNKHDLIALTRISAKKSNTKSVKNIRICPEDPMETIYYDEPDFGDAYEPAPVSARAEHKIVEPIEEPDCLIGIDEFEEK